MLQCICICILSPTTYVHRARHLELWSTKLSSSPVPFIRVSIPLRISAPIVSIDHLVGRLPWLGQPCPPHSIPSPSPSPPPFPPYASVSNEFPFCGQHCNIIGRGRLLTHFKEMCWHLLAYKDTQLYISWIHFQVCPFLRFI